MILSVCAVRVRLSNGEGGNESPGMTHAQAATLIPELRALGKAALLRIDGLRDATTAACLAFLAAGFRCWIEGRPEALLRLVGGAHAPLGVTLQVEGPEAIDTTRPLAQTLFDAGVLIELRLRRGTALREDAARRLRTELCALRVLDDDELTFVHEALTPVFSVTADGCARRSANGTTLISRRIGEVGMQAVVRDLELDRLALAGRQVGWPRARPLTRGGFRRSSRGAPFIHAFAQPAVALFDDAFERWVAEVGEDRVLSEALRSGVGFANIRLVGTAGVFAGGTVPNVVLPRPHDQSLVLVVALWVAQGDRDKVRSTLGLQRGQSDASGKHDLATLEDLELRKFVEGACDVLARAVIVLARSWIEWEYRREATEALRFLGSPRALDAAKIVAASSPSIGAHAVERFGNRTARDRMRRAKNARAALAFLDETVERLCEVFAPRGGGNLVPSDDCNHARGEA